MFLAITSLMRTHMYWSDMVHI